jgi:oxepin-CoA hydrolase/3-oxo-5,6-dehydrosuberyl-CoA semialdehyde dehydrogenase
MRNLRSYVTGTWVGSADETEPLLDPATEEILGSISGGGVDRAAALAYARGKGGPALRAMTFAERATLLQAVGDALQVARDELLDLSVASGGNTRGDAKFDIDGAIATLAAYAEIGREIGAVRGLRDGDGFSIGRSPRLWAQHVFVPRRGVALHINAFNFPAWGLAEKAAVAWLAGMPVLAKPASSGALVAHRIAEVIVEKSLLPEGALSLVLGRPGDLLDHLEPQDVVAFTGSGRTAAQIRSHPRVAERSVRTNVEADSLNAAVLGPDVVPESETYALFLKDVLRDMTQKAGQKCTAIRRVLVPQGLAARVSGDLSDRLKGVRLGRPSLEEVRMGPLASRAQLERVRLGIDRLRAEGRVVCGDARLSPIGVEPGRGFFVSPTLVEADPTTAVAVHEHEVFGPVATVLPYPGESRAAAELVARGGGGLVASIYSEDAAFVDAMVVELAPHHGRIFLASGKIAEVSPGPGTVLPTLVHGGPGHAGGGEELGGRRGLAFYMQRVALEGGRASIERLVSRPDFCG